MRIVHVSLGRRSYQIKVGTGLLADLGAECAALKLGKKCAVITDSNVGQFFGRAALESLTDSGFDPSLVTVPAGEKSKRLSVVEKCHDQLARHRLERKSFIVALGGGVTGDLAGFVAATYLRGIPFVQVPTSLLAQVDSSVGGKTGVNLKSGKNLVGAFYQPQLVLCDLDTLKSLPRREYVSGLAEIIKYGIIADADLFSRLECQLPRLLRRESACLLDVVARCCELKARVVRQDETESGLRAILNFGHTIGHAIENSSGYGHHLHGEAIAIGQTAAAKLSSAILGFPMADSKRIERLLVRAGLPVNIKLTPAKREKLFDAMLLDKKVRDGEVRFVLVKQIGKAQVGCQVSSKALQAVL